MDVRSVWARPELTRERVRNILVLLVALAMVAATLPTTAVSAQEAMTPEIDAGDADHVFTFADDVVGERPSYISLPWQQTDVQVIDSEWALDGKALQISPYASNAFFAAVFDGVPDRVNTEVLMRFRDTGSSTMSHWMTGAGSRIQGAAGSATGVLSQTRGGRDGLVLARVTGDAYESDGFPVTQDNYLRTRWVDGLVSAKMWGGSLADEPEAWSVTDHELDAPTLAAGGVGITRFFAEHTTEVDYVTVDELPDPETEPEPEVKVMAVGNSITTGSTNTDQPQPTYRMYLYDHLVGSGLEPGTDFDFVGPYDTHPSSVHDYLRQGEWDHDSLAVSGWRTANVRDNIGSGVATYDPDVLLILVGVNDLRANIEPTTARDQIDEAITNARSERPDIKILLAEIPPAQSSYDEAIATYNGLLSDLAAERTTSTSSVQTVDMYTGYDRDVHHYDDLHPNAAGDELIASRWADALHTSFGIGDAWGAETPTAPVATIISGPEGTVETGDASFAFTSDTAGSSFECRLVDDPFEACTSPYTESDLAVGDYTFEVRAIADGLTGQAATQSWTVATPGPDPGVLEADPTTIDFGQVELDTASAETITLSNTGASSLSVTGANITDADAAAFAVTTDLPVELPPGATTAVDLEFSPSDAGDANAVLTLEHTGGNEAVSVGLSGEGTSVAPPAGPVVTITSGPEGTVDTGDASFEFTSDTAGASFECRLVDEAFAACTSPHGETGLADGDYTFEVRAIADGVTGDPVSRGWTVATPDPEPEPEPGPAPAGCYAVSGDWNGSDEDGIGWWCDGRAKLRTSDGGLVEYSYGRPGDIPVVADWDGDGLDSISVIRDGIWYLNNRLQGGSAERDFVYGRVSHGDVPITGAWESGARDLPGIVRDKEWHLRDAQSGGPADRRFTYGRLTAGDLPLVGDWSGDTRDTVGVVREGEWLLRNRLAGGAADLSYIYGRVASGDVPVTGDWTGNGVDTPAIVRNGRWYLKYEHGGGAADRTITFGAP